MPISSAGVVIHLGAVSTCLKVLHELVVVQGIQMSSWGPDSYESLISSVRSYYRACGDTERLSLYVSPQGFASFRRNYEADEGTTLVPKEYTSEEYLREILYNDQ